MDPRDETRFPSGESEGSIWNNLVPPIVGLIGIAALACGAWVLNREVQPTSAVLNCAAIPDDHLRLNCFDQLAVRNPPAKGALAPKFHTP